MGLRIAFLTDEFVVENPSKGGLATFVSRAAIALSERGHTPEVFVKRVRDRLPDVVDFQGVRVELVRPEESIPIRLLAKMEKKWLKPPWHGSAGYLATALALAKAVDRRQAELPFDVVHSTNCSASGLFVGSARNRVHVVRLSSHRELLWRIDGDFRLGHRLMARLERTAVARADTAYAPSRFVADHFRKTGWRGDVKVIRPPAFLQEKPAGVMPDDVPEKYLVHFGAVRPVKGTDVLLKSLPMAWRDVPDLRMVIIGGASHKKLKSALDRSCRESQGRLQYLGALPRDVLYEIVKRATASVLPSRADNLPNTVIESILLGTPVIGSNGASIDELVEPGVTGSLVDIEDSDALAKAMVDAWRGKLPPIPEDVQAKGGAAFTDTDESVNALLSLISEARKERFG